MYYINLFIIALLLSSCASTSEHDSATATSGQDPFEQSDSEISEYKKAITLLNTGKLNAAKEIFLEFKSDRPELAGPYTNLALIALENNKPEKAFELVKIAVIKNPKQAQALNLLAYFEQISGDIKAAEQHYKDAIKYKDKYVIAHYNLALLYDVYLQDVERAITHYEHYMKLIDNKDKKTADWLEQLKRTRDNG